jgi:predicted glycosyltransferase
VRVLFWVQHLLGTGHLRRALTVGAAMAERGLAVTIASGGQPGPWPASAGVELVQLPPARVADARFSALVGPDGGPVDGAWRARRRDALLALFERVRPDALVTEMFPFGRGMFRFELLPLLDLAARASPRRPRVLCSVRDVLVTKTDPARYALMRDLALARYDAVLVHTDPEIVPFSLSFPLAADLGERLVSTGFVVDPPPAAPPAGAAEVLVSAGGGAVGGALLGAAIAARPRTRLARAPWRLVAGGNLPPERIATLRRDLPAGVVLDRQRDDFPNLLARSLLSVSQAGYNTVWEAVSVGRPMVLVPFGAGAETEQRTRAGRLAALGLAEVVAEDDLTPYNLARAIDAAAERAAGASPAARPRIDLGGAAATARFVAAFGGHEGTA